MERLQSRQADDSNIQYKHTLYEEATSTKGATGSSLPEYHTKTGEQFNPAMSPMSLNLPTLTPDTQGGISSQEVGVPSHGARGTAVGSPGGLVTDKHPLPKAPTEQSSVQQQSVQSRALPQRTGPVPHRDPSKGLYLGEHGQLQDRPTLDPSRTSSTGGADASGQAIHGTQLRQQQQQQQHVQHGAYGQQTSLQDLESQKGHGQQHQQFQQKPEHGLYGQQTSLQDFESQKHHGQQHHMQQQSLEHLQQGQRTQHASERSTEHLPHHATVAMAPSKAEHQIQPHLGARSRQATPFERIRRHSIRVEIRELGLGAFPSGYDLKNFTPYFGIGIGPYLFQDNFGMPLGQELDLGRQNQGIHLGQQQHGLHHEHQQQQQQYQQQQVLPGSTTGHSGTQVSGTSTSSDISRPMAGTPGSTAHTTGHGHGQPQVSVLRSNLEGFCLDPFRYLRSRRTPKVVQGQTITGEPVLVQINPYNGPLARRRLRKAQARQPTTTQATVTNYPHLTTGPTVTTQEVPQGPGGPVVTTQPQKHKHHKPHLPGMGRGHHHERHHHRGQQQQQELLSMSGHRIAAGDSAILSTSTIDPSAPRAGVFWQKTSPQKWGLRQGNTISFENNPISFYCDLYNDEITFELYDFNNRLGLKNFFHPSHSKKPLTHGVEPFSRKEGRHMPLLGRHKESHTHGQEHEQQASGQSSHQPLPLAWGKMSIAPLLGVPGNSVGVYEQYLTLSSFKHSTYPPIRRLSDLKKGSYQPPQIYADPLRVPDEQRHVWSPQAGGHALHARDVQEGGSGGNIEYNEDQWLDRSFCKHQHTSYFDQEMCRAHTDPMMTGTEDVPMQAYCLVRITRTDPGQAELTANELNIQPIVIPYGASVVDIPNLSNIIERGRHQGQLQQQHVQHGAYGQQTSLQDLERQKGIGQQHHVQHGVYGQQTSLQDFESQKHHGQQQQPMTTGLDTRKEEHVISGTTMEHQDFKKDLPISKSSHEKKVEDPMYYTPSQEPAQRTTDTAPVTMHGKEARGLNVGGVAGAAGVAGVAGGAMGTTMLHGQDMTHRAAPTIAGPISSGQKGLKGSNVFYQDVTNVGPTTFGQQVEIQGGEAIALPAKAPYSDSIMAKDKLGYSMEPGTKEATRYHAASASMLPGALGSAYLDEKHRLTGDMPLEQDPTSVQDVDRLQQHKTYGHDDQFATVTEKGLPYGEDTAETKASSFQASPGSADRVLYPPVKVATAKDVSSTWKDSPVGRVQAAGIGGERMLSPYAMSDMNDPKFNDPNAWLDRVELALKYAKSYNVQMAP